MSDAQIIDFEQERLSRKEGVLQLLCNAQVCIAAGMNDAAFKNVGAAASLIMRKGLPEGEEE